MSMREQVITLICAQDRLFVDIPVKQIKAFQRDLLDHFEHGCSVLCHKIDQSLTLTDEIKNSIIAEARAFLSAYRF